MKDVLTWKPKIEFNQIFSRKFVSFLPRILAHPHHNFSMGPNEIVQWMRIHSKSSYCYFTNLVFMLLGLESRVNDFMLEIVLKSVAIHVYRSEQ